MAKKNDNSGKFDSSDEKRLEKISKLMKEVQKSSADFSNSFGKSNGFIDSISSQLFGLGKTAFFEKVQVSTKDITKMKEDAGMLSEAFNEASEAVNKGFGNALNSARAKGIKVNESISTMTNELSKKMPGIAKEIQDAFDSKNLANLSPEAMKQFKKIVKDKEGFDKLNKFFESDAVKDLKKIENELKTVTKGLQDNGKEVINIGKGFDKILDNLTQEFNLKNIRNSLLGFDQTLTKAQMDSGIMFKNNSTAMAELTSKTQQFGMGIAETSELMSNLGTTLRTTDFNILSQAAGDMAAIGKATGLSSTEVGELGSQIMLMGKSSKDVSVFAESTMKSAMNFGVNGRKVMQDIVKNIPKFRQMGFQGGEESLKKMALQAEHFGQNIDEIFDMSKRARNIEGALDMASQLQLAGGSFANINPMDLLSAARKGPQELQKILGQMGKDIGKFDKSTGQTAFEAVDNDRLQMVADATGVSVDSLQKQIMTMNKDAQKTELIPPGLFDNLNDEEKAFLLNNIGKDGSLTMKMDGVDQLGSLQKGNIREAMKQAAADKGNLEDQAKQNVSFQESVKNLKDSIMNVFVVFEPVIKALTRFIQWLNTAFSSLGVWGKVFIAGLIGVFALVFSAGKQVFNGMMFRKGFDKGGVGEGIGGMLGGKKSGGAMPSIKGAGEVPQGGKPGGFLQSLGEGLKFFGKNMTDILKGAFTLSLAAIMIGGALIAITFGIAKMGGDASGGQLITFGIALVALAGTLWLMSKVMGNVDLGNVVKGTIAMVLMGVALIPFAFAMQMMSGIPWTQMLISISMAALTVLALTGIGALLMTPAGVAFLVGAAALAIAGVSLAIFGASLLVAAAGFSAMANINWAGFSGMGSALISILPGILGLAGIGIFAIPSLLLMSWALGGLAAVMVVLAPAMQMAALSTNSMAEGIGKLKEAVKGIDVDKLNSMASAAERISTASAIGGLVNAVTGIFGGGGKEEKQQSVKIEPITINLKLNGRELQTIQIEDTKLIS